MPLFKLFKINGVTLTADTQNPTGAMDLYTNLGYKPYQTLLELKKKLDILPNQDE